MCLELHWTEYLKAIGPTIIAILIVYIAYQQWRVNQANLRERLFERRFVVFKETQAFLSEIFRDAKLKDSNLANFHNAPQVARFLFDKELADYLLEIRSRAIKMRLYALKCKELEVGEKGSEFAELHATELKWLNDQLDVIFDKFDPYLGFTDHK